MNEKTCITIVFSDPTNPRNKTIVDVSDWTQDEIDTHIYHQAVLMGRTHWKIRRTEQGQV